MHKHLQSGAIWEVMNAHHGTQNKGLRAGPPQAQLPPCCQALVLMGGNKQGEFQLLGDHRAATWVS